MRPLGMMIKECLASKIVMARLIWCDNWGSRAEAKQQDKTEKQVTVGVKMSRRLMVTQTFLDEHTNIRLKSSCGYLLKFALTGALLLKFKVLS